MEVTSEKPCIEAVGGTISARCSDLEHYRDYGGTVATVSSRRSSYGRGCTISVSHNLETIFMAHSAASVSTLTANQAEGPTEVLRLGREPAGGEGQWRAGDVHGE